LKVGYKKYINPYPKNVPREFYFIFLGIAWNTAISDNL